MWELNHKEDWALKNGCFQTVVLEKPLESPLDSKEIKQVNPKRNKTWKFIRRTDAEAEAPILWPPNVRSRLIGRDPDAGKDWGQKEKGTTGWHHQLNGHEFEQTPGDSEGQGSLVCCSPWGHKKSDTTERLNNNDLKAGANIINSQSLAGWELQWMAPDSFGSLLSWVLFRIHRTCCYCIKQVTVFQG